MRDEEYNQICSNCILSDADPVIKIDKDGLCNFCKGSHYYEEKKCYAKAYINAKRFWEDINEKRVPCLLMLSGGKDSVYIIWIDLRSFVYY